MLRRLATALLICSGALTIAVPTARADDPPVADAPVVGTCHQLTQAVTFALSDPTAPVPCADRHNTMTVAVLPSPVALSGLSDAAVAHVLSEVCYPAYWQALGGSPRQQHLSDFVLIDYAPTPAERAAGANWLRCDVGMANGRSLAPLPPLGMPVMPQPLPRSLQRCLTGRHLLVPCSRPHTLHAVKAFLLTGHLGSGAAIFRQAGHHCRGLVWVTWAPTEAWALGDHWATCYARSKR